MRAPRSIASTLRRRRNGTIRTAIPLRHARPVLPAGELPTPVVTLNIEGSEVTPSGQPVVYKLVVRNVSAARAHNVVLKVTPPKNATKVHSEPAPTHDKDTADQIWEFKTLEPGQSRTVELSYKPKDDADDVKLQARVQIDFGDNHIAPFLGRDQGRAVMSPDRGEHPVPVRCFVGAADQVDMVFAGSGRGQQRPLLHEPGQPIDMTAWIVRRQVAYGLISEYRRPA